ncbi:MAG: sodium-dependent transporter, partial [Gammaproteobacteria bacterium]|nr:sodium-dependent transporter [Gammaproteobacteria bacterium]
LVSSIPPDVFLPLGGLLIAIFAAWVMPREKVVSALGVGESGYLVWRNIIRWVSIPLTFIVLLAGLL